MANPIYAILSDIHGNLEALTSVLTNTRKQRVTDYICLGDIVGYNANPVECIEKIRELKCVCVKGNHDHYCSLQNTIAGFHAHAADAVGWTRQQLSEEDRKFLNNLKMVEKVKNFTIVHSTLDMPEMWGYVFENLEAEASFNYQTTPVCFFGHTHVPLAFEKGPEISGGTYKRIKLKRGVKYFVNPGSIGQPRDGDPKASYAIYNSETREINLFRVSYDIAKTQRKNREAGLPEALALRLEVGR